MSTSAEARLCFSRRARQSMAPKWIVSCGCWLCGVVDVMSITLPKPFESVCPAHYGAQTRNRANAHRRRCWRSAMKCSTAAWVYYVLLSHAPWQPNKRARRRPLDPRSPRQHPGRSRKPSHLKNKRSDWTGTSCYQRSECGAFMVLPQPRPSQATCEANSIMTTGEQYSPHPSAGSKTRLKSSLWSGTTLFEQD